MAALSTSGFEPAAILQTATLTASTIRNNGAGSARRPRNSLIPSPKALRDATLRDDRLKPDGGLLA